MRNSIRLRLAALLGAAALAVLAAPQAGAVTSSPATAKSATLTAQAVTLAQSSGSQVFENNVTGLCMDLPNYGAVGPNTAVSQYYCNTSESGDNQDWHLVPTRSVNGTQLYEIVNDKSNLCLDLPNYGSDAAGTHLYVYYCNSNPANDNQEWSVWTISSGGQAVGTAFENFKSSGSAIVNPFNGGECLDVSGWASDGSDFAENLPLTIYGCYNGSWGNGGWDDHLWNFSGATS